MYNKNAWSKYDENQLKEVLSGVFWLHILLINLIKI